MYGLLIYSLRAGLCLAAFCFFFKLLLSRETLHRFNRIVLLGVLLLSFVLPLCVITVVRELPAQPLAAGESFAAEPTHESFVWRQLVAVVFSLGAVVALGRTLWSIVGVLRIVRRGRCERLEGGGVLVRLDEPIAPCSWGRYMLISEADYVESGREIVAHEQAHLRLGHSWDLLVTDIAGCLQWFNPAMWLLRRELRAIHEYEADAAVLRGGIDARRYQTMLIQKAAGRRWCSVANSFNHSKLKNRITMMLQKKSSRWAGAKVLFVVPLTALALGAFARTVYVVPEDKVTKENGTIRISGADSSAVEGRKPVVFVNGRRVDIDTLNSPAPGVFVVTSRAEHPDSVTTLRQNRVTVIRSGVEDAGELQGYFSSEEWRQAQKQLAEGFSSEEWQQAQKQLAEGFSSEEWQQAQKQLAEGFSSEEWQQAQKQLAEGFSSEEWRQAQKQLAEGFSSEEWQQAQKQLAEGFSSEEWRQAQRRLQEAFTSKDWKRVQRQFARAQRRFTRAQRQFAHLMPDSTGQIEQ